MGQCAVGPTRPPSALNLCQALEKHRLSMRSSRSSPQSPGSASTPDLQQVEVQAASSIWQHVAEDEVRALGDIVEAWSRGRLNGLSARRQLQSRVLRGEPLLAGLGALAGNLLARIAALVDGDHANPQTHEVFSTIDGVFLCSFPEDAHGLAMRELGLDGLRPMPDEVRACFQCRAKRILEASDIQGVARTAWLDLVRLCLCVEVLRHLKAPGPVEARAAAGRAARGSEIEGWVAVPSSPTTQGAVQGVVRRVGNIHTATMFTSRQGIQGHPSFRSGLESLEGHPSGVPSRIGSHRGMELIFIAGPPLGLAPDDQHGLEHGGAVQWNASFRLNPAFLRERVGSLLEVVFTNVAQSARPVGLTAEEMDRHCPEGPRKAEDADSCCPICLEPSVIGEVVRTMPCRHQLHKQCCEAWLATADSCPTCRYKVPRN
mmetsp:Transcript_11744/g.26203  ORF Transcript_11744/g.26203 Transcript_11744/m.26203 type:complete len:431 (+) Transcript_11744:99-1391(+)